MFRNYLAAALRNLARNRFYAALNISGLAVGFSAALLIVLFVLSIGVNALIGTLGGVSSIKK